MKHKGFLLATTGGLVAAVSGAQAADLPMKAPQFAPAPAPVASWTGFYVGLHAGAAWQMASTDYANNTEGDGGGSARGHDTGFIGGGQIGYNFQIAPAWVIGLEADISGLSGKATSPSQVGGTGKGNSLEAQINWLSTFRGRVGWLLHQDTMLYVTGGLAVGGVKDSFDPTHENPVFTAKSVSKTKTGWTLGGGMEHMLTRNWSLAVEALYVDLGTSTGTNPNSGKSSTFKNSAAIARLKVNYRF